MSPTKQKRHIVSVGSIRIGENRPLALIAGPCVVESFPHALRHAKKIGAVAKKLGIPFIYKSSYDKANRTSLSSFRGLGMDEGLLILKRVKEETNTPILTDVHSAHEAIKAAGVADVLQIPAFLCRQTDILAAAARTGKVVNVKKGQFLAPWEMGNVVQKISAAGNDQILITERGTSFGYNTLVSDFRGIPVMKAFGYPVIFDATHSVQQPGGQGKSSGGQREFIPVLAQAAVVAGVDGVFMEVHEDPKKAPSDGPNQVPLKHLERLLERLLKLREVVKKGPIDISQC